MQNGAKHQPSPKAPFKPRSTTTLPDPVVRGLRKQHMRPVLPDDFTHVIHCGVSGLQCKYFNISSPLLSPHAAHLRSPCRGELQVCRLDWIATQQLFFVCFTFPIRICSVLYSDSLQTTHLSLCIWSWNKVTHMLSYCLLHCDLL